MVKLVRSSQGEYRVGDFVSDIHSFYDISRDLDDKEDLIVQVQQEVENLPE